MIEFLLIIFGITAGYFAFHCLLGIGNGPCSTATTAPTAPKEESSRESSKEYFQKKVNESKNTHHMGHMHSQNLVAMGKRSHLIGMLEGTEGDISRERIEELIKTWDAELLELEEHLSETLHILDQSAVEAASMWDNPRDYKVN